MLALGYAWLLSGVEAFKKLPCKEFSKEIRLFKALKSNTLAIASNSRLVGSTGKSDALKTVIKDVTH